VAGFAAVAAAQELEPRTYSNIPVGLNFFIAGYAYQAGGIATDPSSPIQDAELKIHTPALAYARSLGVFGKSAKLDLLLSYGSLSGTANVAGQPARRDVSGLWDPRIRFSVNLLGAPALTLQEFATYRQDWILGVSLQVGIPLGQYDDTRLINLGTNRWSFKPEVGVSKEVGRWMFELAAAATLYTDNDDFFGGKTREQDPLYSVQGHAIYNFPSRIWVAVDGTYYWGGAATADGEPALGSLRNSRVGATLALPIDRANSVKLFAQRGISARVGANYSTLGAFWQLRWGAGIP